MEYYASISSYYVNGEKETGYECCKKIIMDDTIDFPEGKMVATIRNLQYYVNKNNICVELFYRVNNLIKDEKYYNNDDILKVWKILFKLCGNELVKYDIKKSKQGRR